MGNTTTKNSRRHSISTGSTVKRVHWGSSAGLPAPPGKPILIPSLTEDSQPIIVGIRWERSPSNGGSAIIGYLVEHRRVGSPHWIRSSPGLCSFPELTLSGLEPGWRYQFRVRAQNGVGLSQTSELSDPLTVTLQRAVASAPCFLLELTDTIALENEQAEFIVHFTGTPIPKISWFKDGFEIFSSRRTKIITENGRSSLLIHQTALNDEGEIKCTATNKAGYVSTRGKLLLEALPRIRLPRQYEDGLLFEKGETIRLKVSVAGRPPPNITWYHDGEIVIFDDRHMIESIDTGEYSITILTAMRNDRGEYMIKAVNKLGEDNASFLVTVTDRPAAPGKVTIIMTLGRSVTLSWKEPNDDGGCKIGTYIIEYYRIGWDVWLKAGTSRQATTTLGDLIGDSEYKFRVKAENPYGVSDPSEESDVVIISNTGTGSSRSEQALDRFKNSQNQMENNIRGRKLEKYDQTSGKSTKRTRSLTRDEIAHEHAKEFYSDVQTVPSRSVSAQRLIPSTQPPTKPARSDSRVTFATTVCLHGEQPLDDIEIPLAKPRVKNHKSSHSNNNNNNNDNYNYNNNNSNDEEINHSLDLKLLNSTDIGSEEHSNLREKSMSPLPTIRVDESSLLDKTDELHMHEEEYESERMNEEFMLVLYPDDEGKKSDKKYPPDDSRPPITSLSLPELFSTNYDVIEVLRDAFSSTELLHELAVERFYKAVAMEESDDSKTKRTEFEKIRDGLDYFSYKLRSIHSQKASTMGGATPDQSGIRRRWNRRSSEGYTESLNTHRLSNPLSSKSPQLVLSDSNLRDIEIEEEFRNKILRSDSTNSTSLHRWDDKSMPLVPEDKLLEPEQAPSSELSHNFETFDETFLDLRKDIEWSDDNEDKDSVTSEDLNLFKSRVLGQSDIDDNRNIMSTPQDESIIKINTIQPKSILKKRTEEISFPLNSFGRPIPPEKVIVGESKLIKEIEVSNESVINCLQYGSSNLIDKEPNLSDTMRMSIMSDIESDNTNLVNAAEVAQNRRKSNGKYPLERKQSTDNEEDIEAQRAVINHYTEIMREYSMSPPTSSARFTPRINSSEATSNETLGTQESSVAVTSSQREEIKTNISSSLKSREVSVERKARISKSSKIDPERNHREKSTSRSSSRTRKKREPSIGKIVGKKNSDNSGKLHTTDLSNTLRSSEPSKLQSSYIIDEKSPRNNKTGDSHDATTNKIEEILIIQTRMKVQSTMSYIIDLTLFLAAVYIYFFKKEIFAIPFICLILYRRIQKHMANWIPRK